MRSKSGFGMNVRELIQEEILSLGVSPLKILSLITPTEAAVPTASRTLSNRDL